MNSLPPPPQPLPKVAFTGGIRQRPLGWGGTAPFGHLEFDDNELRIWALGMELCVKRGQGDPVACWHPREPCVGHLAGRVQGEHLFAALGRGAVREALQRRGWPVVEGRLPTA